ncbi:hypothetical protein N665_0630s0029 [Sinapis alba]|nr:hypothetical protein N665_0630s0029 [Sinapis alba]
MALMASSSSSTGLSNWDHDVFPSFHGEDVRQNFLSHMLKEFRNKGIHTFIDNKIERGESIGPELKRAIKGSKIAIVVLSEKYASSTWCLDELLEIVNKQLGQTVVTVFYKVNPTDVKKQIEDFGKFFEETCQGKTKEKIETWRQALEDVATIAGYHSIKWENEATMIEEIAADVLRKLNISSPSRDFDRLIGMGAHMEKLESLLRLDLDGVRMIGIWGPLGIGKSTIARILFNQFSASFQLRAIMVNIKGSYPQPCLDEGSTQLELQKQMLSQMLNEKDLKITHLGVAQERLKGKKVFLVLDDVDKIAQLLALAGNNDWFGPGSRIVITTEDQRVLKAHGINDIYKVDFPTTDEAFQMFCMYAFDQKSPKDGFIKVAMRTYWFGPRIRVVLTTEDQSVLEAQGMHTYQVHLPLTDNDVPKLCMYVIAKKYHTDGGLAELACEATRLVGRLPLGIKVMGSYFRGKSKDEWTATLPGLTSRLFSEIESILKLSYDALDDEDKDFFRHIACFFCNKEIEKVVECLEKRFPDVRQRLVVLYEKSLISTERGLVTMHGLLAQLGKNIDRKQPQHRQYFKDIYEEEFTDDAAVIYKFPMHLMRLWCS